MLRLPPGAIQSGGFYDNRSHALFAHVTADLTDRLSLSLQVIDTVLGEPALAGWDGFGVVVQAYGQRASHVLDYLHDLATRLDRRIMVRLVKGAYWDTEIKQAQGIRLK